MNPKRALVTTILLLLGLAAGVVLGRALKEVQIRNARIRDRTLPAAHGTCRILADHIEQFYASAETQTMKNVTGSFLTSLTNELRIFSVKRPVEPYCSPTDFGIYLFLPSQLPQSGVQLLAYTDIVGPTEKTLGKRCAVFWSGGKSTVAVMPSGVVGQIVGLEAVEKTQPSVYFWRRRFSTHIDKGSR